MLLSPNESTQTPELSLKQQAIEWLVLLRSDDIGEEEIIVFADWLAQDHAHSAAFSEVEKLFDEMTIAAKLEKFEQHTSNSVVKQNVLVINPSNMGIKATSKKSRKVWLSYSFAMAAVWLFLVMPISLGQFNLFNNILYDYHTDIGGLREVTLEDGSQLLLNTNSAVSVNFSEKSRQIILHHGQVRFTVAKDTKRPFQVMSEGLSVKALGTVFEVYKNTSDVSVIVQEHAVLAEFQSKATTNQPSKTTAIKVQQGEQFNYYPTGNMQAPKWVDLKNTSAWQQRLLMVNDRPLGDLLNEISRYRVGQVFMLDNKLKNLHVTGVFSLEKPDEIIVAVGKALDLKETKIGPWWVLLNN